jgi:hypothetical protein
MTGSAHGSSVAAQQQQQQQQQANPINDNNNNNNANVLLDLDPDTLPSSMKKEGPIG